MPVNNEIKMRSAVVVVAAFSGGAIQQANK